MKSSPDSVGIPFNIASTHGREAEYVASAIKSGRISGDQLYSRKCQELLEQLFGIEKTLLTTSCTHALEISAHLLNINPGDEVILPSFTFVSTANAFVLAGATPVFCDVREDTLNLDEAMLGELIGPRTKAVVPVHYAGVGCEMDEICRLAGENDIAVIEDNAHGLFGKFRDRWLGTFGSFATQSFHETKNLTCGEGGALLINDPKFVERAEIIREKGTNRSKFFKGLVDKYSWVDIGSSYVISDILAAYLFGQLEVWRDIQKARKAVWDRYQAGLADWCEPQGVRLPFVPEHCEQAYHMFYLMMPTEKDRDEFIEHMKRSGIGAVFHYLPLHSSTKGREVGKAPLGCPVTDDRSRRLVRLPFYSSLGNSEQDRVIERVLAFECGVGTA